jgi:hypothetical protein
MIPVSDISSAERSTALFFNTQTTEAIIHAVSIFDNFAFNSVFIRKHAESFDEEQFVMKIKKFVIEKHKEHCEAKVFDFVN